ncbi:MAG: PaaI family thioesterase [Betaproteobacteria bacterium]
MERSLNVSWDDPRILSDAASTMSGIEFLQAIRDGRLPPPPIARLLGMRLAEVERGHAVFEVTPAGQHYNPIGVVHGGLAMTLLDSAMACSVQTQILAGSGYTTLEVKINLVRAITSQTGKLRSSGKVLHAGNRIATAEGRLEDASGKLYAHGTTTCIVLNGS